MGFYLRTTHFLEFYIPIKSYAHMSVVRGSLMTADTLVG